MMLWVFLVAAVALVTATVVLSALAWLREDRRTKYVRWAVVCGLSTVLSLVLGSMFRARVVRGAPAQFANDYLEDMGADTFLETVVTSTSR